MTDITQNGESAIDAETWAHLWSMANQRWEGVTDEVLQIAADGGSVLDIVQAVGRWLDGCDSFCDEELAALYGRACERAAPDLPQPGEPTMDLLRPEVKGWLK